MGTVPAQWGLSLPGKVRPYCSPDSQTVQDSAVNAGNAAELVYAGTFKQASDNSLALKFRINSRQVRRIVRSADFNQNASDCIIFDSYTDIVNVYAIVLIRNLGVDHVVQIRKISDSEQHFLVTDTSYRYRNRLSGSTSDFIPRVPGMLFCRLAYPGLYRILVDVSDQSEEIIGIIARFGTEPVLKKMSNAHVLHIEIDGIPCADAFHGKCQRFVHFLNQQVDMVRHQTVRKQPE